MSPRSRSGAACLRPSFLSRHAAMRRDVRRSTFARSARAASKPAGRLARATANGCHYSYAGGYATLGEHTGHSGAGDWVLNGHRLALAALVFRYLGAAPDDQHVPGAGVEHDVHLRYRFKAQNAIGPDWADASATFATSDFDPTTTPTPTSRSGGGRPPPVTSGSTSSTVPRAANTVRSTSAAREPTVSKGRTTTRRPLCRFRRAPGTSPTCR